MLDNPRALMIAWGVSLVLVLTGFIALEISYTPAKEAEPEFEETEGVIETDGEAPAAMTDMSLEQPLYFPELVEKTSFGELPRVSPSGRKPWEAYASPAIDVPATGARIAIVVRNMGLRRRNTERAFDNLPPAVTFAFSPYGSDLDEYAQRARREGHEILMQVPMESINLQLENPGDLALLADRTPRENLIQLKEVLGRMHGYGGIIPHMGSRFTATVEDIQGPILDEIAQRGLLFVDNRTNVNSLAVQFARNRGIPTAFINRHIDRELVREQLNTELLELEARARQLGAAVGEIQALPIGITAVSDWLKTLDTAEFTLVPVSQIVERQPTPRR